MRARHSRGDFLIQSHHNRAPSPAQHPSRGVDHNLADGTRTELPDAAHPASTGAFGIHGPHAHGSTHLGGPRRVEQEHAQPAEHAQTGGAHTASTSRSTSDQIKSDGVKIVPLSVPVADVARPNKPRAHRAPQTDGLIRISCERRAAMWQTDQRHLPEGRAADTEHAQLDEALA